MKKKRLLTIYDLINFCETKKMFKFSSAENDGLIISVQVPDVYEIFSEGSKCEKGLYPVYLKACHTGKNQHRTIITDEKMEKCKDTFKNRPILANFTDINGEWDFTSHDIEIDEDGNYVYIERPVGIVPESSNPHLELDEENQRNYLMVNGYIYEEYGGKTIEILERKKKTRCSVELNILEFSYSVEEKCICFDDFYFNGVTLLGTDPDTGGEVLEGMEGSRLSITDFSVENNSLFSSKEDNQTQEKTLEMLNKINENIVGLAESLNGKEEDKTLVNNTQINPVGGKENHAAPLVKDQTDNKFSKTFEISQEDVRTGLYKLLEEVDRQDNDYYFIVETYNDKFIYHGCCNDKYYQQKYSVEDDAVKFDGERVEVFAMFLNSAEKAEIENLRENFSTLDSKYSELETEFTNYRKEVEEEKKVKLQTAECYALVSDSEEFKTLFNEDELAKVTLAELTAKCDAILLECAKSQKFSYATGEDEEKKYQKKIGIPQEKTTKKNSRYGSLFD